MPDIDPGQERLLAVLREIDRLTARSAPVEELIPLRAEWAGVPAEWLVWPCTHCGITAAYRRPRNLPISEPGSCSWAPRPIPYEERCLACGKTAEGPPMRLRPHPEMGAGATSRGRRDGPPVASEDER